MNQTVKTFVTSLVVGAITSAATTMVIAKLTAKPPSPPCAAAGVKLPAAHCAALTGLQTSARDQAAVIADLRRRLAILETSTLRVGEAGFCYLTAEGASRCAPTAESCAAAASSSGLTDPSTACRPATELVPTAPTAPAAAASAAPASGD